MFYYRSNVAGCYFLLDKNNQIHQYGSLTALRMDWPFAHRVELQPTIPHAPSFAVSNPPILH